MCSRCGIGAETFVKKTRVREKNITEGKGAILIGRQEREKEIKDESQVIQNGDTVE